LQELKDPIKWVILNLSLEDDSESKKDCKKLKNQNLQDYEWDFLNQLIEFLYQLKKQQNG